MNVIKRRLMPIIAMIVFPLVLSLLGGPMPAAQGAEPPARVVAYAGNNQTAPITASFGSLLEARVLSASGEPVPGETVTFELPATGRGASFDLTGAPLQVDATTDANGIARSPGFTANSFSGSWTATAAVEGLVQEGLFNQKNSPAGTGTAVYSTPVSSLPGQAVVFTAVIGSSPSSAGIPPGNITFEADGNQIGQPAPIDTDGVAISDPITFDSGDVGNHVITASFDEDPNFGASSAQDSFAVAKGGAVVDVATTLSTSSTGDSIDIVAMVDPLAPATDQPTGQVQFIVDGSNTGAPEPLNSGQAQTSVPVTAPGTHVVRALYSGDDSFSTARGVTVRTYGAGATSTALTSSDPGPVFGSPITLTAQVTGPGSTDGEVTFAASSQDSGLFELCSDVSLASGQAQCVIDPPLGAGEYELTAGFEPGQLGVEPSEDKLTQIVSEAPAGIELDAEPDPASFGAGFDLNATVTAGVGSDDDLTGAVQFSANGATLGDPVPLAGGEADLPSSRSSTSSLAAGPQVLAATYGGDRDFVDASTATVISVDPVDTGLLLAASKNPVAFGNTLSLTADVSALGDIPGTVGGSVQFWIDGLDRGDPVPLTNGSAQKSFSSLDSGGHDIRAYFAGSGSFGPSEGALFQTVDSPPPAPEGILPCSQRDIVLTSTYRSGKTVRFEGVARYATLGMRVNIKLGKQVVAQTNVGSDGTFWASTPDPSGTRFKGVHEFQASVNGKKSWPRRLAQAVSIRERITPGTKRTGKPRIQIEASDPGRKKLTLVRQTGCSKIRAKTIKAGVTSRNGIRTFSLTRPAKGKPYAIYRIRAGEGDAVSTPIVVRSAS